MKPSSCRFFIQCIDPNSLTIAMVQITATRLFLLLLSRIIFNFETACGQERSYTDGAITTRVGFSLKGSVMKTLRVPSIICCTQHCLKESRCISTNFKFLKHESNGMCELNDAALLAKTKNKLSPEEDVIFSQYSIMKKVHQAQEIQNKETYHVSDFSLEFPSAAGFNDSVILPASVPKLQAFTICFWMKTDDRDNQGTPFSYAVEGRENEIVLKNYKNFRIQVSNKSPGASGISANDGKWHHICVTWENNDGSWNLYKDGGLEKGGAGLKAGAVIDGDGILVLGKFQGDRLKEKNFIGQIAHLNIWSHVLPNDNITRLSQLCLSGEGNAVKWSDFKNGVHGNISVVIPSPCRP